MGEPIITKIPTDLLHKAEKVVIILNPATQLDMDYTMDDFKEMILKKGKFLFLNQDIVKKIYCVNEIELKTEISKIGDDINES